MRLRFRTLVCVGMVMLCLVFSTVGAISEELIDMSQYFDDEIISLIAQFQTELVNRGIEKTASLKAGKYIGGKDIPAGAYVLICKTDSDHHGIVWLSAADDDLENDYPSKLYEHISFDKEETFYIEIEEGGILNLPFAAELQISGGVLFK